MSILVTCGQCNRRYSVGDQLAGKRLKCKACGAAISVTAPAADAPDDDPYSAMASLESSSSSFVAPPPIPPPPTPSRQVASYAPPAPALMPAISAPAAPTVYAGRAANPREERSSKISAAERLGGMLPLAAGIVFLVTLIVVGLAMAGAMAARSALIAVVLLWAPVLLANGLLAISLIAQESAICVLFYLFVPFYALYYVITRWDTMGGVVRTHLLGVLILVGAVKVLDVKTGGVLEDSGNPVHVSSDGSGPGNGGGTGDGSSPSPRRAAQGPAPREPLQISEEQQRFDQMARQVQDFISRDFRGMTREQALTEWTAMNATLDAERKQVDSRVINASLAWGQLTSAMSTTKLRMEALPSEAPPASVFQDPTDTPQMATPGRPASLGDEVSFRTFFIRPPAEALLDLSSADTDEERGMVWAGKPEGGWSMSIRQSKKANPRQKQPWVANHSFAVQGAQKESLLLIDTRDTSHTSYSIGGVRFWRTMALNRQSPNVAMPTGPVRYTASVGDDWLVIEFNPGDGSARYATTDLLDDAVRSFRPQKAGEPKADPFTPERIAKRLADQPEQALRILRSHRSAAEPAVLPLLTSPDPAVARAAANYLADFGTKTALPDLRKAATSADLALADPARAALRRLVPEEFDAFSEMLLDLKGADPTRKSAAVGKVLVMPIKPERKQEIATILEDLLLNDAAGVEREAVGKALVACHTDTTAARLLPILSKEDVDPAKRDAAMDVVVATGSKPGAAIIIRWLLKEPDKTVAALIRMGPAAEDPTIKLYNSIVLSRDAEHLAVRANCVRILSAVGVTPASIQVLTRASKDTRDIVTQEVAKAGIESVKARMTAKKPTP